jgi:hypothetical protein
MDAKTGRKVIAQYRSLLQAIPKAPGPFDRDPSPREAMSHVVEMLGKMEKFLDEVEKREEEREWYEPRSNYWDEFNRWLGFVQGVFWLHGDYTLNQMRDHNRT